MRPYSPSQKNATDESADDQAVGDEARPEEVAEYLAGLLESARGVAGKAGLTFLSYLIQVAVEEARIQAAETQSSRF